MQHWRRLGAIGIALALGLSACEDARVARQDAAGGRDAPVQNIDKPGTAAAGETTDNAISAEALAAEAEQVRKLLDKTFIVEAHGPFVIAGNQGRAGYDRSVKFTIMGAYHAFYRDFFTKRPDKIITIYLFRENLTYRKWAGKLFGDTDVSHFGYYKPDKRALVMNIGTGGGTLVHEMTHAFVHFDFPKCPAWFNEGMGSLFEACSYAGGHIRGLMNWRYPVLKRGLGNQRYTPMAELVATTRSQFYEDPFGMHYAQARYFCLYLQEKGWLRGFYKQFRDDYAADPTGRKQIEKVTGKGLEDLEQDWLVWVKTLKYEGR